MVNLSKYKENKLKSTTKTQAPELMMPIHKKLRIQLELTPSALRKEQHSLATAPKVKICQAPECTKK
jgi:hypothetical protein